MIYEGSLRQWEPALGNPARNKIRWIFMRDIPGNRDEVYTALYGTAMLNDYYRLVYNRSGERVYKFVGSPAGHRALGNMTGAAMRHGRLVRHGESQ